MDWLGFGFGWTHLHTDLQVGWFLASRRKGGGKPAAHVPAAGEGAPAARFRVATRNCSLRKSSATNRLSTANVITSAPVCLQMFDFQVTKRGCVLF